MTRFVAPSPSSPSLSSRTQAELAHGKPPELAAARLPRPRLVSPPMGLMAAYAGPAEMVPTEVGILEPLQIRRSGRAVPPGPSGPAWPATCSTSGRPYAWKSYD
jgi:hypothetical protein